MPKTLALSALLFSLTLSTNAQKFDLVTLAKVKTVAVVIKAESTVSCGDGSDDNCLRNDADIAAQVRKIVEGTDLWQHVTQTEATKADAIVQFKLSNPKTANGRVTMNVVDADTNKPLFWEYRDILSLENDVTRMVSHFVKIYEDAKAGLAKKTTPH